MKNYIKKMFKWFSYRESLNAQTANTLSRFGVNKDFDTIVKDKVKIIENQIYDKLRFSNLEKLIVLYVPEDKKDLYEEIKKHFSNEGFKTFYANKNQISELGNNTYLFISWDI